jgi:hypothetical protein
MSNRLELKIPPVAVAAPSLVFLVPFRESIGVGLALAGLLVSLLGVAAFKRAQTTVNPMKPGSSPRSWFLGSTGRLFRSGPESRSKPARASLQVQPLPPALA